MKTRPLLSAFLLSLATSFMFFVFEPVSLFVNNPDDFWFSIPTVLPILLGVFAGCVMIVFLILFAFELFCKKFLKKQKVFDYTLVILVAIFLITYIQGNFLSASLPGLSGKAFAWQDYPAETAFSIALWIIAFVLLVVIIKKLSVKKVVSYIPIMIGAVLVMLTVGLISTVVSRPDALVMRDEEFKVATYKNYNLTSRQQNFYILLVDAVSSQSFDEILQDNPDYQTAFQDFTYYPDTTSYYAFTQNSVPQLLTGIPNHNETSYDEYLKKAYGGGYLFDEASKDGYRLNLYESKISPPSEVTDKFENYVIASHVVPMRLIKQIIRFDLYKYLPYPLKSFAKIENCNFDASEIAKIDDGTELFNWSDLKNYNVYKNQELEISDDKIFSFIHLEGAHQAFDLDENMQQISPNEGTYQQKEGASFTTIKAFLDRLKHAGVYDNSVVIVLSDHGSGTTDVENASSDAYNERINPILYIKGIQETHPEMIRSDKPISFTDLGSAYNQLLQGRPSTELFADISYPRTRKSLLYDDWLSSEEMNEYETEGTAWDLSQMRPTGVVYRAK